MAHDARRRMTRLFLAALAWLLLPWAMPPMGQVARAATGVERLHQRVAALALRPVPPLAALRAQCREDTLCAARLLARALGPRARLQRISHPDTDAIRLVRVRRSITSARRLADGGLQVELRRFGIKAVAEMRAVLHKQKGTRRIVIDLRRNGGGNVARMLRIAALFTGPLRRAVRLRTAAGERWLDVPAPAQPPLPLPGSRGSHMAHIELLVGPGTASSAEILAALLRRHAGARMLGRRTHGKNWLSSAVPVGHDWQLLVPSAIIEVPGETLSGGLRPDAAM